MRSGGLKAAVLGLVLACFAGAAQAQSVLVSPPPVRTAIDENGVDLPTGNYTVTAEEVVIGKPGAGALTYVRTFFQTGWRHSYMGTLNYAGGVYTVSIGGSSETFTLSGGVYVQNQGRGSTLTFNSANQTYTYTLPDGSVGIFDKSLAVSSPAASEGLITSLTKPDGEKIVFTYKSVNLCVPSGGGCSSYYYSRRLQSVNNSLGYQLKFSYASNTATNQADDAAWSMLTFVVGVNNTTNYCDPTADSCSGLSSAWPSVTYATPADNSSARTVTDELGRVTRYTYSGGKIVAVRPPSSSTDNITITYNTTTGRVATVSNGVGTWTYGVTVGSPTVTTITDPLSHQKVATTSGDLLQSIKDGLNHTTSFGYDSYGRLTQITQPEGDYVTYAYDGRGNVTQVTRTPKAGSGLSNIVTSAAYDATCTNPLKCNEPNSTTDERGGQTDYTYDATHGGLMTVTRPAPTTGAIRPQTRYSYVSKYAYYKDATGTIVQAATPVWRLSSTSACATTSSCTGTADEILTVVGYAAVGSATNLLPLTITHKSGNGALTATTTIGFSAFGDLLTVNGPLSGSTDLIRYRYDGAHQLVGVEGPDPDGAGPLKYRAQRITYDFDGRAIAYDRGTVNSLSDTDWNNFALLERNTIAYDSLGRKVKETLGSSLATYAVTEYSYDNANRLDCTAVRMNPNVFDSLPAVCTQSTYSGNGWDRITKNAYDAADQLTSVTTAYGTAAARTEVTYTYTTNGKVTTQQDAHGGKTTFEYDGFDRLSKTRYPLPTTAGSSSTTDYEQYTYDAASNVTQDRRRDGALVALSYDALNRQTTGIGGVTYGYDNLNRMTSATLSGQTLTFAWDALSRQTGETGSRGTVASQYDVGGRRTQITWPDGFYVNYDYDLQNEVTAIRENGTTSGAGVLASIAYDDLGQRTALTRGNGATSSYGYDPVSRLASLGHDLTGATNDVSLGFTYNPASEIVSRGSSNSAYDPPTPSSFTRAYASNYLNRQTTVAGVTLSYDTRGNLSNDGAKTYGYDVANRLTSVTGATLAYDPAGRLTQTVGAGVTTNFLYDGDNLIGEYDASGTLLRRYVHGPGDDEPLVWYEGSGVTDRRWLLADDKGSIVSVTDATGASIATNTYDEYGQPGVSNTGRFQYTGQIWVPEVELYHYKARAYSPTLGRFLQTDPIGYDGGLNLYAYVRNDPVNAVDPKGLFEAFIHVCVHPGPYGGDKYIAAGDCWDQHVSFPDDNQVVSHIFSHVSTNLLNTWRNIQTQTKSLMCHSPAVAGGGGLDAYAVVGGSVSSAASVNPSNGQISISLDVGVGLGAGVGGRVSAGKFVGLGNGSNQAQPIAGAGVNLNFTGVAGAVGATGSYQLLGSNKGDWGAGYTGGAELSGNVNLSAHGQINIPSLYNLGC